MNKRHVSVVLATVFSVLVFAAIGWSASESSKETDIKTSRSTPTTVFTGPIKISGKASGGLISFTVSESWDAISEITVSLRNFTCKAKYNGQDRGVELESWSVKQGGDEQSSNEKGPITRISKGKFKASSPGAYELDGALYGKKKAKGKIHLTYTYTSYYPAYESWSCDMGIWEWDATAQ